MEEKARGGGGEGLRITFDRYLMVLRVRYCMYVEREKSDWSSASSSGDRPSGRSSLGEETRGMGMADRDWGRGNGGRREGETGKVHLGHLPKRR